MREIGDIDKLKNQYIAYLGFEKGLSHNSVEAYVDDTEKFLRYVEEGGKQLEKPLVLDEARLLELLCHVAQGVLGGDLHSGRLDGAPVEGAQIAGQHPAHPRQQRGGQQHQQNIEEGIHAAPLLPGTDLGPGRRLTAADLAAVPAGGISLFEIRHKNLLFLPLPRMETDANPGVCFPFGKFFQWSGSLGALGA